MICLTISKTTDGSGFTKFMAIASRLTSGRFVIPLRTSYEYSSARGSKVKEVSK